MGEQVREYLPDFTLRTEPPGANLTVIAPEGYHLEYYVPQGRVLVFSSGGDGATEHNRMDMGSVECITVVLPARMKHRDPPY